MLDPSKVFYPDPETLTHLRTLFSMLSTRTTVITYSRKRAFLSKPRPIRRTANEEWWLLVVLYNLLLRAQGGPHGPVVQIPSRPAFYAQMAKEGNEIFGSTDTKMTRAIAVRIKKTLSCVTQDEKGRFGSYSQLRLRCVKEWQIKNESLHKISSAVSAILECSPHYIIKLQQRFVELRRDKQNLLATKAVQRLEAIPKRNRKQKYDLARARLILRRPMRQKMSRPLQRILDDINKQIPEVLKKDCVYHWTWTVSSNSEFVGNRFQSVVTQNKIRRLEIIMENGLTEVDISACAWQIGNLILFGEMIEGDLYDRLASRIFTMHDQRRKVIKDILTSAIGAKCLTENGIRQRIQARLLRCSAPGDLNTITKTLLEDPLVQAWGWKGNFSITMWVESLANTVLYTELTARGIWAFTVHDAVYVAEKDREITAELQSQCLRLAAGIAAKVRNTLDNIKTGTYDTSEIRKTSRQIVSRLPPVIAAAYSGVIARMFLNAARLRKLRLLYGYQDVVQG